VIIFSITAVIAAIAIGGSIYYTKKGENQ